VFPGSGFWMDKLMQDLSITHLRNNFVSHGTIQPDVLLRIWEVLGSKLGPETGKSEVLFFFIV
jgi:hypothetical protein